MLTIRIRITPWDSMHIHRPAHFTGTRKAREADIQAQDVSEVEQVVTYEMT